MSRCEPNHWKGFVLGVVGAIPGILAMDYFWKVVSRLQGSSSSSSKGSSKQRNQSSQSGSSRTPSPQSSGGSSSTQVTTQTSSPSHLQEWQRTHHIISPFGQHFKEGESSTAAMGRIIYRWITGKEPQSEETQSLLSNLTHWGFGLLMGGVYGACRDRNKVFNIKEEVLYATGLWLFADEIGVPLLGLSKDWRAYPLSTHLEGLGAHLVYGLAMGTTIEILNRIL